MASAAMAAAGPAAGWPSRAAVCSARATTATPRAVPSPRAMFTIPPAAAACPGGIAVMIAALLAGI